MLSTHAVSINFCLDSVKEEADEKVLSMVQYSDVPEKKLLEICAQQLSPSAIEKVSETISFAGQLDSVNESHPSMRAYLSHPVRVATLALRLLAQPDEEVVFIGLLHNVFEVSGISESDLVAAGYSERAADGIRLMTVDRKLQSDEKYLTEFYAKIESFGADLALVKCVDKLDNLLAFQLIDGPIRNEYLDLTDHFVRPLAARLSPQFGAYFEETVNYMRTVGCDPVLKARYDSFRSQVGA